MIARLSNRNATLHLSSVTVQISEGISSTYLFTDSIDAISHYVNTLNEWRKQGYKMVKNKDFELPDFSHSCKNDSYPMIHYFENEPVY